MNTRILEIRKQVLNKNNQTAAQVRERFASSQVIAINVVSSPGSGKTLFLEQTLRGLRERGMEVAALMGDVGAGDDGRRLAVSGAAVRQIDTQGLCHLEAAMIAEHLRDWDLHKLDYLFIENVGNLVCPSNYDLGETLRAAMLSVDEGEDKPLKYPGMFQSADIAIVTKSDLAEACDFDRAAAYANIEAIRPGIRIFEVSAKRGAGMSVWIDWLLQLRTDSRASHTPTPS